MTYEENDPNYYREDSDRTLHSLSHVTEQDGSRFDYLLEVAKMNRISHAMIVIRDRK